jgi:hypothetical protein
MRLKWLAVRAFGYYLFLLRCNCKWNQKLRQCIGARHSVLGSSLNYGASVIFTALTANPRYCTDSRQIRRLLTLAAPNAEAFFSLRANARLLPGALLMRVTKRCDERYRRIERRISSLFITIAPAGVLETFCWFRICVLDVCDREKAAVGHNGEAGGLGRLQHSLVQYS